MMVKTDQSTFDFDQWAELARTDPEGFETRRKALIDAVIEAAPEGRRQRLVGLQWRIDQVRRLSRTPLGACVRLSGMMWDAVSGKGGLVEAIERLAGLSPEACVSDHHLPHSARILALSRPVGSE